MTTLIGIDKLESANPMNAIDEIKCDTIYVIVI